MEFGKVSPRQLSTINFDLPQDATQNRRILGDKAANKLYVYVGCPIWVNSKWIGDVYPLRTNSKQYLLEYGKQFDTIELNSTHYHTPALATIDKWRSQVSDEFRFAPKIPQDISHKLILEGKAKSAIWAFYEQIGQLRNNLGTAFMQLPPYFAPSSFDSLEHFLQEDLPADFDLALELRHPDWFKDNNFEKIAHLLTSLNLGTVITDVAGRRDVLHMRLTNKTAMLRFVGNADKASDYPRVDTWVERFAEWIAQGLESIYFFAHQPDNDVSPELCRYFCKKMNESLGLNLPIPKRYVTPQQGSLF